MNMTDITHAAQVEAELVDERPFFAPVASDLIDRLIGEYNQARSRIDQVVAIVAGDLGNVLHYFIDGNAGDERMHRSIYVDKLFQADGAIAALDSAYWSKALSFTDVYECMPQERKNAWTEQMRNPAGKPKHWGHYEKERAREERRDLPVWEIEPLPHFEEATVRSTITELLVSREKFLAEKVDGIFRNLSGEHVTNAPEAFGKRMIISRIVSSYGSVEHDRAGYIHDLRCVIAKFMGRGDPGRGTTFSFLEQSRSHSGKWLTVDGGALRLKTFIKGTAHLEVHPDMAYRLNQILAYMHPNAIPAEFRLRPKRRASKEFAPLVTNLLSFAALELLCERQHNGGLNQHHARPGYTFRFNVSSDACKGEAYAQARRVLESIGGVADERLSHVFCFDYDYFTVLQEIRTTGAIPDQRAHQFYPTPEKLAAIAAELLEVGDADRVLEPSAGQGDLAAAMPKDRTVCIEVSPLHCAVLRARGFEAVHEGDFLAWAPERAGSFERVLLNPPFSDGRWRAHLDAALSCVKRGGRLVAILPSSARNALMLDGSTWTTEYHGPYNDEFAGTSASVVILVANRA